MQTILKEIYDQKRQKCFEQKLSLRSFARFLGINIATISRVFAGKEELSLKHAKKIIDNKNIDELIKKKIMDQYFQQTGLKRANEFSQKRKTIRFDFNWIDTALAKLFDIDQIDQSPENLARILSVEPGQILESIQRLERHELIHAMDGHYACRDLHLHLSPTDEESLQNIRKYERDLALRGLKELEKTAPADFEARLINSSMVATQASKVPEAKKMIVNFQNELVAFLTEGEADTVYALSSQFFPLAREIDSEKH